MRNYKILSKQSFEEGDYSLVPLRHEDRYKIMHWRNEQVFHLRQSEKLTTEKQDLYFKNVINNLFDQNYPKQILFSFLKKNKCVGYGGLVHINWNDKTAEISFVMETNLEKDYFEFHWCTFLNMIEKAAFNEIGLNKIYTHAFDLRPLLYSALEKQNFIMEKTYIDIYNNRVVIHSKIK